MVVITILKHRSSKHLKGTSRVQILLNVLECTEHCKSTVYRDIYNSSRGTSFAQ